MEGMLGVPKGYEMSHRLLGGDWLGLISVEDVSGDHKDGDQMLRRHAAKRPQRRMHQPPTGTLWRLRTPPPSPPACNNKIARLHNFFTASKHKKT
jgi:hypothetical protein